LLVKLLQPLGFEVREATNGQEAVQVWQQWAPHLIWMDIKMPVMDGYEATRRIRDIQRTEAAPETVIVALTASALEHQQADILAAGCDALVRKPFREDEILDTLAQHLGVRYVYESGGEERQPELPKMRPGPEPDSGDALTPSRLAALSPDLVADLQRATVQGRYAEMLAVAERIREHDAPLADKLTVLIEGFEYGRLLALIEKTGALSSGQATERT
jgi:CheY-like chemotaxis protein